jgi:hypothetical protein
MEHLEFLVEETSMEAALRMLVPKILPGQSFDVHPHEGKRDLLQKLETRLRGYHRWLPQRYGIVVVIDKDHENCRRLKAQLEATAALVGFRTRSRAQGRPFRIINWLAIEELEAWFFGDVPALIAAYPGVPASLASKAGFRDPDAIQGGTWETLERVLQRAGYHLGGLKKIEAARAISAHMDPTTNRSRSFQGFRRALEQRIPAR